MKFALTTNYISKSYNTLSRFESTFNSYNNLKSTAPMYKRVFIKITKTYALLILFTLIVVFYYVYIYMNLFLSLEKNIRTPLIIFHSLFIMFILCLIRTLFTSAGDINAEYIEIHSVISFMKLVFEYLLSDRSEKTTAQSNSVSEHMQWLRDNKQHIINAVTNSDSLRIEEQLLSFEEHFLSRHKHNAYCDINSYEINHDNNRFCGFCLFKKPDRTHHCRYCHRCQRKLDHHCLLLATCIGENNYKFFCQTLFYLSIMLMYMIWTSFQSVFFYIKERTCELVFFIYVFYFTVMCGIAVIECWFFLMHVKSIINNVSTIEYKEKMHQQNIIIY